MKIRTTKCPPIVLNAPHPEPIIVVDYDEVAVRTALNVCQISIVKGDAKALFSIAAYAPGNGSTVALDVVSVGVHYDDRCKVHCHGNWTPYSENIEIDGKKLFLVKYNEYNRTLYKWIGEAPDTGTLFSVAREAAAIFENNGYEVFGVITEITNGVEKPVVYVYPRDH